MERSTDFSVVLVLFSVLFVLWTTRRLWCRKQCPYCRYYNPALATKCGNCHEWYVQPQRLPLLLLLVGSGVWAGVASGQSFQQSPCAHVSFFVPEDCEAPMQSSAVVSPAAVPGVPLFTKETVSPYTTPELLYLSNNRTIENARQYVRRQLERNEATEEVTRLVHQAWQEMGIGHAR